jgi:hypothetical protein
MPPALIETEGVSSLYCSFITRAGIEMNASENVMVKMGASFNVSATSYTSLGTNDKLDPPFVTSLPVPVSPYSVGLNVAVVFRIKAQREKAGK